MTSFTINGLISALKQLPPNVRGLPVRVVLKTEYVDRGPLEGCYAMEHVAVCGVACGNEGLLLFVDQDKTNRVRGALPPLPPKFETGNAELDGARRDQEDQDNSGEDWKKG